MHVLVIPYNYPTKYFSHRAVFVADQVKALRYANHKVNVLGCIPKTLKDILKSKSIVFGCLSEEKWLLSIPALRGRYYFNEGLAYKIGKILFKRYIKVEGKPDVIHVHNVTAGKLALWVKKVYSIPFVVTEHSSLMWSTNQLPRKKNEFNSQVYLESHSNIAVSDTFASHLSSSYQVEFNCIPNVVNTDFFVPMLDRKNKSDVIIIASVGNLTANKNHILLIRAISAYILSGGKANVIIVGDGPEKTKLEKEVKLLKLEGVVTLTGCLSRQGVLGVLQQANCFILPSLKETFGVVLIEAMSCGLPVFALKNGGSESIVKGNVGMLALTEDKFMKLFPLFVQQSYDNVAIRQYVVDRFSSKVIALKLLSTYQ
tara:strand:- start:2226 stop:3338 length:1113 start_codon:yes stop_codon:yes gene_type:complete